jgi:hypothetical protein
MGIFDKLFSRRRSPRPEPADALERDPCVRMQRAYWQYDAATCEALQARGVQLLPWQDLFRLHHQLCLRDLMDPAARRELGGDEPDDDGAPPLDSLWQEVIDRLLLPDSPYRPTAAALWQGSQGGVSEEVEPDLVGSLQNASLTHLGAVEVLHQDGQGRPTELDFVPFGALRGIMFAPPTLFRAAMLHRDDGGEEEIVLVPVLYGLSWHSRQQHDRDGTLTRFIRGRTIAGLPALCSGIGIGHQDWTVTGEGAHLLGLGSVAQMMIALDVSDPTFEQRCRSRGLDPTAVRRQANQRDAP